jgi:hypothetical protein
MHILELPRLDGSPGRTGTYRMYALNSKVLVLVVCALVTAVVVHVTVYLSIDAGSLSAAFPVNQ